MVVNPVSKLNWNLLTLQMKLRFKEKKVPFLVIVKSSTYCKIDCLKKPKILQIRGKFSDDNCRIFKKARFTIKMKNVSSKLLKGLQNQCTEISMTFGVRSKNCPKTTEVFYVPFLQLQD